MLRGGNNFNAMLITVNTRSPLTETAQAVAARPCPDKHFRNAGRGSYPMALAARWMR
jgi:hypothetical protein